MDRDAAARAIESFLKALGRDPAREPELAGTPERVAAAWADELLTGYAFDVVVVRDVPVATMCPHHLMPSVGVATVAYAPEEHLVGVGTVARLVDAFARRLALQEQMGERVVAALQKHLAPRWAACRIVLSHSCMTARGERSHGARVETLALSGGKVAESSVYAAVGVGR